jgi:hypothetical protein
MYHFHVPKKPDASVNYHTVRFYARGEHLLHIDSDGDVYSVERLYDSIHKAPIRRTLT